jgi:hypothetical protein
LNFGVTPGIWEGTVTINGVNSGANQVTLRAMDAVPAITGDSNAFTMDAGPLHHFTYTTNPAATETAGLAIGVVVEARDSQNNLVDTYVGPATVSDTTGTVSETGPGLGDDQLTFVGGIYNSNLYITKSGSGVKVTVTDNVITTATGVSSTFVVQPGAADHFTVVTSIGSPQQAGVPFNVRVEARDAYENILSSGANIYDQNDAVLSDVGPDTLAVASPATLNFGVTPGIWEGTVTINGVNSGANQVTLRAS